MGETDSIRSDFVDLWASMGAFWGVPPATARVYGWLLSREGSSSADEIVQGLGMSRGAVSMACRDLREWGLVHPRRRTGTRQMTYAPETDQERAIHNIVAMRKRREWDPIVAHLREWIPRLEAQRSREARVFRERLEAIEALVGMADSMAESFLKGGLVQKLGLKALVAAAARKRKKRSASR